MQNKNEILKRIDEIIQHEKETRDDYQTTVSRLESLKNFINSKINE